MLLLRIQSQLHESHNWLGVLRESLISNHTLAPQLYYFLACSIADFSHEGLHYYWFSRKFTIACIQSHSLLWCRIARMVFESFPCQSIHMQRAQALSKSTTTNEQQINELKRTANQKAQAHMNWHRSSTKQIQQVKRTANRTGQSHREIRGQQMKVIKRTAHYRGQAHSKWKRSSAQQVKGAKQAANQWYQAHSKSSKTFRGPAKHIT